MMLRTGNLQRYFSVLLFIWLGLAWTNVAYAELSVSVDRTEITDADLLKLTIRIENATASTNPDFSVLERDFDIMQRSGPNQSSRISIINGRQTSEVFVTWELRLRPKRLGVLTIPAFRLGNDSSRPIQIRVNKQSEAMKRKMSQLVFFETTVDTNETYVQGQILYTVKLYYVENISGDFPAPPALEDAVVEIIENERRYDSITNGRRYYVLEKRYGIYPQKSGTLTIPAQTFSGYRVGPGFFSTREPILSRSEAHTITVNPKPANFPGDHWLPAADLTLDAKWLNGPPEFVVGEPINRSIEINAKGVAASLLPALPEIGADGVKSYQDPPVEEQSVTADGINSKQTTVVGIVPTHPGPLVLPEVRIPWWNTRTDRLEYALIPEETFTVAPSPTAPVLVPNNIDGAAESSATPSEPAPDSSNLLWQAIAGGFFLLWICTLIIWRWQAKQTTGPKKTDAVQAVSVSEQSALKALESACKSGDGYNAQRHLLTWAQHRYGTIYSVQELANLSGDSALRHAIQELEQALFSPQGSGQWRGNDLITAVKGLKVPEKNRPAKLAALNPA